MSAAPVIQPYTWRPPKGLPSLPSQPAAAHPSISSSSHTINTSANAPHQPIAPANQHNMHTNYNRPAVGVPFSSSSVPAARPASSFMNAAPSAAASSSSTISSRPVQQPQSNYNQQPPTFVRTNNTQVNPSFGQNRVVPPPAFPSAVASTFPSNQPFSAASSYHPSSNAQSYNQAPARPFQQQQQQQQPQQQRSWVQPVNTPSAAAPVSAPNFSRAPAFAPAASSVPPPAPNIWTAVRPANHGMQQPQQNMQQQQQQFPQRSFGMQQPASTFNFAPAAAAYPPAAFNRAPLNANAPIFNPQTKGTFGNNQQPAAAGRPSFPPAAPPPPAPIPLCRQHLMPMKQLTSRQEHSQGRLFWMCPLSKAEQCKSFTWDEDVHKSGLRFATVGADGQLVSDCKVSCEIVSDSIFSITVTPPDNALRDIFKERNATIDQSASLNKQAPNVFLFALQRHDEILNLLEKKKAETHARWQLEKIPLALRQALLDDIIAQKRNALITIDKSTDQQEEDDNCISSSAVKMSVAGKSNDEIAFMSTQSQRAQSQKSAASASSGEENEDDEDQPLHSTSSSTKKKRSSGPLLKTKAEQARQAQRAAKLAEAKREFEEAKAESDAAKLTAQEETCYNEAKMPPCLAKSLLAFQKSGVEFMISKAGRALLADEMVATQHKQCAQRRIQNGLGKTLQSIAVCAYYNADWPLLIICPSSLRLNWQHEIHQWMPFLDQNHICAIKDGKQAKAVLPRDSHVTFGCFIISYDLATKHADLLRKRKFQVVVCDESHFLKNATSKRTKSILPLLQHAKRAILLSGTPALNRPAELYTQICALRPSLFPYKFNEFAARYCDSHQNAFGGMDYSGSSHLKELHVLLKKFVLIRREKKDVLSQLPAKRRQTIFIDIDKKACAQEMKQVEAFAGSALLEDEAKQAKHGPELMKLYARSGEAKLDAVCEVIEPLIEDGRKFLIFAHHKAVLNGLESYIRSHPILPGYFRIDGSTPSDKRQEYIEKFASDENCKIALLSIMAAGTGITMTAASTVVFAELVWTPAMLVQAEDRVHRLGQTVKSHIIYCIGANTIDDLIWPLISRKLAVVGEAVSGSALSMSIDEEKKMSGTIDKSERGDQYDRNLDPSQHLITGFFGIGKQPSPDYETEGLFERPMYGAKRRKTGDSSAAAAAASSSSASIQLVDQDDDDIDLLDDEVACTPASSRGHTTATGSAESSKSAAASAAVARADMMSPPSSGAKPKSSAAVSSSSLFAKKRPTMVSAALSPAIQSPSVNSPAPTAATAAASSSQPSAPPRSQPSKSKNDATDLTTDDSLVDTSPSQPGISNDADNLDQMDQTPDDSQPIIKSRRRKRFAFSDDDDDDGGEADPGSHVVDEESKVNTGAVDDDAHSEGSGVHVELHDTSADVAIAAGGDDDDVNDGIENMPHVDQNKPLTNTPAASPKEKFQQLLRQKRASPPASTRASPPASGAKRKSPQVAVDGPESVDSVPSSTTAAAAAPRSSTRPRPSAIYSPQVTSEDSYVFIHKHEQPVKTKAPKQSQPAPSKQPVKPSQAAKAMDDDDDFL